MKSVRILGMGLLLAFLCAVGAEGAVIVGDAMLADIVSDLLPKSEVVTLVAPMTCPGHGDARLADLKAVAKADAVVITGWQRTHGPVRQILDAAGVSEDRIKVIDVVGSWLVPDVQGKASEKTAGVLAAVYPEQALDIVERLIARLLDVEYCVEHLEKNARLLRGIPVICALRQREFLAAVGMSVIGDYGRTEELSVTKLRTLVASGKAMDVAMVVDNLQSGQDAGKPIAEALGVPRVILSNFPGEAIRCPTYKALFMRSFGMLVLAAGKREK